MFSVSQDHFKSLRVEEELQKESEEPRERLDLSLKEGQTIKVNINIPRKSGRERSRSPGGVLGVRGKKACMAVTNLRGALISRKNNRLEEKEDA